jgi:hypothetical protein
MSKRFYFLCLLAFAVTLFTASAHADTYFVANATSAQEVPPNASTATGFCRVTLNSAETSINVSCVYSGLSAGLTAAHIHTGNAGANGPVTFNFNPTTGNTSGSIQNLTFAVTAAQVDSLKNRGMYVNFHTSTNPGGEIRGQLLVNSPYVANMTGGQENPGVNTTARGNGVVSVNDAGTQAFVTMNWTGLSGNATAGHVHSGRSGVNGPVVCNLAPTAATSGSVVDFLCNFTTAQTTSLKQAQFYLNIHTAANPGGEVRGQIQRRRSTVLDFDGDGKTDYANTRTNATAGTTEWYIALSGGGQAIFPFGLNTDNIGRRMLGGDYDGDGKDDPTIWRSAASASFFILQSSNNTVRTETFGITGDNPTVVYDYDGDGRCDVAVYRSSNSTWFYRGSSNNAAGNINFVIWGGSSFPNPGDYDGDGRGDFQVQQSANWWILNSSNLSVRVVNIGTGAAFGVPGDYDGDGKTDVAITLTEASTFAWYHASSMNPTQNVFLSRVEWGNTAAPTAQRAQGDYDGDGKTDPAVYVTNTAISPVPAYWARPSGGGAPIIRFWGLSTDIAVATYNNR